jgi:hypothetical protein
MDCRQAQCTPRDGINALLIRSGLGIASTLDVLKVKSAAITRQFRGSPLLVARPAMGRGRRVRATGAMQLSGLCHGDRGEPRSLSLQGDVTAGP